ncbi:FAD-dependent oxidoreductase [Streptomyces durmitorensis]|uniref:FAD-dependent oxidoreductase n=1 Tax=Streptomyces durmitorensis TaxID=319947 RepID=UPI003D2FD060
MAVAGGGSTGLRTSLLAKHRRPDLDVLVIEQATCAHAASGRNGGFCSPSLTPTNPTATDRPTAGALQLAVSVAVAPTRCSMASFGW